MKVSTKEFIQNLYHGHMSVVEKPWGREMIIHPLNEDYMIKVITVNEGHRTSLQHHPKGTEIVYILEGAGTVEGVEDTGERPTRGMVIQRGDMHRSVGPVTLLEITTAGPDDIVRHQDDHGREGTTGA